MKDLKDKVAVITGGSSGIGLGIARAMAKEGAKLVLVGMTPEKIEAAVKNVQALGAEAIGIRCDVTKRDQIKSMAEEVYARFGRIDILVNNAGLGSGGRIHEIREDDWDWVMTVNVRGTYLCCAEIMPRIIAQGGGAHVINMGSEQCFGTADPRFGSMTVYNSSKHAILGLSDYMRQDYADDGIGVSVVCPGPVATDIWNSERNRPAEFGERRPVDPDRGAAIHAVGMDPDLVGEITVKGLKEGDFYIITHPHIRDLVEKRYREAMAALDKTDKWVAS